MTTTSEPLDRLHFLNGQPFGVRLFHNVATVQCPRCRLWSSLPLDALAVMGSDVTCAWPYIVCGHHECRQGFGIVHSRTTLYPSARAPERGRGA